MREGTKQTISGSAECIVGYVEDAQIRIILEQLRVNVLCCAVTHVKHL